MNKPTSIAKPKRLTAREKNARTIKRIQRRYAETHNGQWIGLVDGKVVAIAPNFEALHEALVAIEPRMQRTMVFQAGESWSSGKKLIILPFG